MSTHEETKPVAVYSADVIDRQRKVIAKRIELYGDISSSMWRDIACWIATLDAKDAELSAAKERIRELIDREAKAVEREEEAGLTECPLPHPAESDCELCGNSKLTTKYAIAVWDRNARLTDDLIDKRRAEKRIAKLREVLRTIADEIPTSWLDPIFCGPESVLSKTAPIDCPTIERLLDAVRKRITGKVTAALSEEGR